MIDKDLYNSLNDALKTLKTKNNSGIKSFTDKHPDYEHFISIYREYYDKFRTIILRDLIYVVSEFVGEKNINFEKDMVVGLEHGTNDDILMLRFRVELHVFYRLYKMNHYEESTLKNIRDLISNKDNENCWYRGQINSEWQLIPSFFRNAKKTKLWDWNFIKAEYDSKPEKVPLTNKLDTIGIDTSSPYSLCSFIQHSIGFSPLIDFSKSPKPALSFAMANGSNLPTYYGDNACVFELKIDEAQIIDNVADINNIITKAQLQVFDKAPHITTLIQNEMWRNLLKEKKSVIHFFNLPTSDRMRFQKGVFVMFDNVIIIGNELYLSFDKTKYLSKRLTKYIIRTSKKDDLYNQLMEQFPHYHPRYLLDPYLYMGENDK